jgi:hypothetical protein
MINIEKYVTNKLSGLQVRSLGNHDIKEINDKDEKMLNAYIREMTMALTTNQQKVSKVATMHAFEGTSQYLHGYYQAVLAGIAEALDKELPDAAIIVRNIAEKAKFEMFEEFVKNTKKTS